MTGTRCKEDREARDLVEVQERLSGSDYPTPAQLKPLAKLTDTYDARVPGRSDSQAFVVVSSAFYVSDLKRAFDAS